MKFRYNFNKLELTGAISIIVFTILGGSYSLAKLLKLFKLISMSIALDVISIILCYGIAIFIILIITTSKYTTNDAKLKLYLVFFSKIIDIKAINCIYLFREENKLIIMTTIDYESSKFLPLPINIKPINFDKFIQELRLQNTSILYKDSALENINDDIDSDDNI